MAARSVTSPKRWARSVSPIIPRTSSSESPPSLKPAIRATAAVRLSTAGARRGVSASRCTAPSERRPSNAFSTMRRRPAASGIGTSSTMSKRRIIAGSMASMQFVIQKVGTGLVSRSRLISPLLMQRPSLPARLALKTSSASSMARTVFSAPARNAVAVFQRCRRGVSFSCMSVATSKSFKPSASAAVRESSVLPVPGRP